MVTLGLPEGPRPSTPVWKGSHGTISSGRSSPSQLVASREGCGGVFWVRLCRELLKCFVLMVMMIIIFFPAETFLE